MNTAGGTIVPASARSPTDVAAIFMVSILRSVIQARTAMVSRAASREKTMYSRPQATEQGSGR